MSQYTLTGSPETVRIPRTILTFAYLVIQWFIVPINLLSVMRVLIDNRVDDYHSTLGFFDS